MRMRTRTYSGTKDPSVSPREIENRRVACEAACEGIVLLRNDGCLPLKEGEAVALFGGGAVRTIKGGTGSGDVNQRESVSVWQGMENHGMKLTSRKWLENFEEIYKKERADWRDQILEETGRDPDGDLLKIYAAHGFRMPAGPKITREELGDAKTAVYVISRVAGEAADRFLQAGDYYLTDAEKQDLKFLSENCSALIVILNTGGQIDGKEILNLPVNLAVLTISQPGMEGGNALAKILLGQETPSGKLTDTWAKNYKDFPNASSFSHNNGDVEHEFYTEGIYVGYRYFDTFGVEAQFPFGFGLSYTSFAIRFLGLTAGPKQVTVELSVKNTGEKYAGKEVVQIYASCPQSGVQKEYRKLCAFAKTKKLEPGEAERITVSFPAKALAYFDESRTAWVAAGGVYGLWVGNSIGNLSLEAELLLEEDTVLEEVSGICPPQNPVPELESSRERRKELDEAVAGMARAKGLVPVRLKLSESFGPVSRGDTAKEEAMAKELVRELTDQELAAMVMGEIGKGQNNSLGAAGIMVPGAAGETSGILEKTRGVPGISMADGPAGVRLMQSYQVDRKTGQVYSQGILGALEGGIFADSTVREDADVYYQYCTAIPVGTMLAQTWNPRLVEKVGRAVAAELLEFGVSWWLAPGMNIHRNPLCGRNFEYFSEDPVVSGVMAAAMTRGVQSVPGVGTTIKHFACNNQEDNRKGSDSILSQRALREIYLRGFEIAVKTAQPMAIMTSYNLINGVHAANSADLCTTAAREEWGFEGLIMTDWTTTMRGGGSIPWKCVKAGNDLIMPGARTDRENILQALEDASLTRKELEVCAARVLKMIFCSSGYEDCRSYKERFADLKPYLTVEEEAGEKEPLND